MIPLSDALKALIFALKDSAVALDDLFRVIQKIYN